MTIPQADSTDLRSVSDRQEVTLAEVVVDQKTTTNKTASSLEDQQQQQPQKQSSLPLSEQQLANNIDLTHSAACVEKLVTENEESVGVKEEEDGGEQLGSEDKLSEKGLEAGNQNALISSDTSSQLNHDKGSDEKCYHKARSEFIDNQQTYPRCDEIVSALPLLKIPSYSSITAPSESCNHRNRKTSINFPISNRDSSIAATASSSYSSTSSLSSSRKSRRKSLPQRLGLRYHKIPQDDIASTSEGNRDVDLDAGILNLQYIPSPDTAPFSSSSTSPQDHSHQLSFHNAEVHASFHPAKTTTISTISKQQTSTSQTLTTSHSINQSQTFPRDVAFKSKLPAITAGSNSSKKDQKSPTSATSSSKNRKSGRGGNNNKSTIPLRRTLSLSLKSLNDLSAVHPAGRGNANRKKAKFHSRSLSTEDLANCRIHRTAGGRFAGDPHPSPGSPSHCCLVSVSRVPMAAATSHLTLDSEYQTVRLAVLGAPGVGKSSIVKQFVMQQFLEEYVPTEQRQIFCPAVIINDHLYEVRIIDCPYIPYFPVNSLYEWTDFRGYGLRNATAYVLVYDITSEESFEYIKTLRLQILESRNLHDVPIFVVGNKHDLAEERGVPRREVANMVKKQWKCGYIECSAKYNWHIMLLFKELMKTVDYIDYGHKPTSLRVQDALRRNRCLIL